jgi:hypothetical protein
MHKARDAWATLTKAEDLPPQTLILRSGGARVGCCWNSGHRWVRACVVGVALHLDRAASALGQQHRALGDFAIDLRSGLD